MRHPGLGPLVLCLRGRALVLPAGGDPVDPGDHGHAQKRYLDQLLCHLMRDGKDHDLVQACSPEQRAFVTEFLAYLIDQYSTELDGCTYSDDILKAYDMWSAG